MLFRSDERRLSTVFYNSAGVLAPEAAKAFRALGLDDCASVIEKAMDYFGKPYPRERDTRLEILAHTMSEKGSEKSLFEELDGDFYKLLPWQNDTFEKAADHYAELYLG